VELPVHPILRAYRLRVRRRGAHRLAAPRTLQALESHQPLDRAARHRHALAVQLPPDLASAIDLQVGSMDSLDLIDQDGIALGSLRHERRVAHPCRVAPVARRGNLQRLADRLDPEVFALLVR
jgi:hypothetical protein